jgi:prepilin-type N-terminal cleavage/methylation domain-containing protein
MKTGRKQLADGFTLIELLVAMFILVIVVMLTSRLFNTASQVWATGTRKAEVNLVGRSVLDYLDRELSRAVFSTNSARLYRPALISDGLEYQILSDSTNGLVMDGLVETVRIRLDGTRVLRGNTEIVKNIDVLTFVLDQEDLNWPTYVDITLKFRAADDRIRSPPASFYNTFTKRVYFPNYSRSRYDDY